MYSENRRDYRTCEGEGGKKLMGRSCVNENFFNFCEILKRTLTPSHFLRDISSLGCGVICKNFEL